MLSDNEVLELLFPFLSFEDERSSETGLEATSSDGQEKNSTIEEILDQLMPKVETVDKALPCCPFCLEHVSEKQAMTSGLGCPCKNITYHLSCFTVFLTSCNDILCCPLCRTIWSSDEV